MTAATLHLAALLERMTLGQLARRIGVHRSTVLRWARGSVPRERAREHLANLGVPDAWELPASGCSLTNPHYPSQRTIKEKPHA